MLATLKAAKKANLRPTIFKQLVCVHIQYWLKVYLRLLSVHFEGLLVLYRNGSIDPLRLA